MKLSESKEYQLLISDIKSIKAQIETTTDESELDELRKSLNELLHIKSAYANMEHLGQVIDSF